MSRIGKIARLSQFVREQLNRRIEDGEPGRKLVKWLNSCESVKDSLEEHYDGSVITEQNLREWKKGGFKDWQRNQETRSLARSFLDEAEELEEEIGDIPLTDRLSETVALALAGLLRDAMNGEKGPQQRNAIMEIAREIGRLRGGDHQMQKVRLMQEMREDELKEKRKAEQKENEDAIKLSKISTRVNCNMLRQEYCEGIAAGTLEPERAETIRGVFTKYAEWLKECGVKDLPASDPAKESPPTKSK